MLPFPVLEHIYQHTKLVIYICLTTESQFVHSQRLYIRSSTRSQHALRSPSYISQRLTLPPEINYMLELCIYIHNLCHRSAVALL